MQTLLLRRLLEVKQIVSGLGKRQLELIGTVMTKALHPNALQLAVNVQIHPHQIHLQWQMSQHHLQ